MARGLTSDFITHATAAHNRPVVLFRGDFLTTNLNLWNGRGDLSWAAQTWLGNGWFLGMEGGEETTEVEAVDMTIVLSAVPQELRSLVLGDERQGGLGALWIAFVDASGALVSDPYLWWKGSYSHAEIDYEPEGPVLRLIYDSPLMDFERPRERRWTDDAQRKLFAGDRGFEYVKVSANWNGDWNGDKKKLDKDNRKRSEKRRGSQKRDA